MALDATANFAKSDLAAGYAAGVTSIDLVAGGGAKFPAVPFNAVWWNSTDFADPADDPTVEIISVYDLVGDTLSCDRAQEGTADSSHNTPGKTYTLIDTLTSATMDQISAAFANTAKNKFWAGPETGAAAPPAFRLIVPADVPGLGFIREVTPYSIFTADKNRLVVIQSAGGGVVTLAPAAGAYASPFSFVLAFIPAFPTVSDNPITLQTSGGAVFNPSVSGAGPSVEVAPGSALLVVAELTSDWSAIPLGRFSSYSNGFANVSTLDFTGNALVRGDSLLSPAKTFATLPASPAAGQRSFITDAALSLALGIGQAAAGGGANAVPVVFDGSAWLIG